MEMPNSMPTRQGEVRSCVPHPLFREGKPVQGRTRTRWVGGILPSLLRWLQPPALMRLI